MYELKDRRTIEDEDQDQGPSVDDRHSDELDRLARRQGIRAEMARNAVALQHAAMLESECRESHARVELAADLHRQECDPLQAELERLERDAVRRIAERSPADQEADRRRRELIGEIAAANAALELVVETEKRLRRPAEIQADRLRRDHVDPQALAVRLAQGGTANPDLLVKLFVAQRTVRFAQARQAEAVRGVRITEANIQGLRLRQLSGDLAAERRRLARWQAELAASQDAITAATAKSNRIHRLLIDE